MTQSHSSVLDQDFNIVVELTRDTVVISVMECSDGKSAETGSGSSIQWPLPDTGGVCRCFVSVHSVTGDTRHTHG